MEPAKATLMKVSGDLSWGNKGDIIESDSYTRDKALSIAKKVQSHLQLSGEPGIYEQGAEIPKDSVYIVQDSGRFRVVVNNNAFEKQVAKIFNAYLQNDKDPQLLSNASIATFLYQYAPIIDAVSGEDLQAWERLEHRYVEYQLERNKSVPFFQTEEAKKELGNLRKAIANAFDMAAVNEKIVLPNEFASIVQELTGREGQIFILPLEHAPGKQYKVQAVNPNRAEVIGAIGDGVLAFFEADALQARLDAKQELFKPLENLMIGIRGG